MDIEDIIAIAIAGALFVGFGALWVYLRRWIARDRALRAEPFGEPISPAPGSRCGLCGASLPSTAQRVAGLDLCYACFRGDFGDRLGPRGIRMQDVLLTHYPTHNSSIPGEHRMLTGRIPRSAQASAVFVRTGETLLLSEHSGSEIQAGDAKFDVLVAVRTDTPEQLATLLQSNRLRAAVCEIVRFEPNGMRLDGDTVRVFSRRVHEEQEHMRCATAIVLQALLESTEGGYRAAPVESSPRPLPDLSEVLEHTSSSVRGVTFTHSCLDDLRDVARLFARQADTSKPVTLLQLERVHLASGSLAPLSNMQTMRVLKLDGVYGVRDFSPVASLAGLEELTIARCTLADVGLVGGLTSLRALSLEQTPVSDLAPLGGLASLQELNIRGTRVSRLEPLASIAGLRQIRLMGAPVPPEEIARLRQALPALEVAEY